MKIPGNLERENLYLYFPQACEHTIYGSYHSAKRRENTKKAEPIRTDGAKTECMRVSMKFRAGITGRRNSNERKTKVPVRDTIKLLWAMDRSSL